VLHVITARAAKGNGTHGAMQESKTEFISCTDTSIVVFVIKVFSMACRIQLFEKVPSSCTFADCSLWSKIAEQLMYFSVIKLHSVVLCYMRGVCSESVPFPSCLYFFSVDLCKYF